MRLGAFVFAATTLTLTAIGAAQDYSSTTSSTTTSRTTTSVIRPAAAPGWRNYVTVPDGPCGYPMSVETDCYNVCHPCGPLHPICFLHRVGRMLDCFLPCNMCCRGGCGLFHGGGLFHGCGLGGRTWGHCGICCGGGTLGGCGGGRVLGSGCCTNPCGSAFANVPCHGGHSPGCDAIGCSSVLPGLSDPFIDDPLPPTPTAQPSTEVRRTPTNKRPAVVGQARMAAAAPSTVAPVQRAAASIQRAEALVRPTPSRAVVSTPPRTSPYKIIADPTVPAPIVRPSGRQGSTNASAESYEPKATNQSVLRRASHEEETTEPAPLEVDQAQLAPIVRSQTPDDLADYRIPHNPLRN